MTEITLVVKQGCETCTLIEPIIRQIAEHFNPRVICQDTQDFPTGLPVEFDASLEQSYRLRIEVVPTLIIQKDGIETSRIFGWDVAAWEALLSIQFKSDLPKFRPGCGSKTHDPGMQERLAAQFSGHMLAARRLNFENVDDIEIGYDQGWSDGLPVVPPTAERVMRMLAGTRRQPDEIIGIVPPDFAPCSIEKIAINAVLAGCRPEYLPVVIAAVEAVLEDQFCMHGLLATTYFSGPMVIVNGPISRAIGMNSGGNALGQGNRANATIGRALQLIIRNVGGGRPGGVDRSALGNPGKYTFCFSEDETNSCWESLAVEKGFSSEESTVTVFAADGMQGLVDQKSRDPESLCRSFAAGLRVIGHPKMVQGSDAFLVVSPEHERIFRDAQWNKQQVKDRLLDLLMIPGEELIQGAGGIAEGLPEKLRNAVLCKFREGGLNIVRAGGRAGLFSAIIAGWGASGSTGSVPVTRQIQS
ncbi:thioredoxin family protein [Pseudomonadales bacterium]|nr:thioredoxin family protein [Pseudomonadales bacterium]